MTALPKPPDTEIVDLIDKAWAADPEPPRPHLGCSLLGKPCDRALWLSFRWAVVEAFGGRMQRLFERGHLEEDRFLRSLRLIGVELVQPPPGEQFRVDFGSHVSGSLDGLALSGVPGAETTAHVLEFKTHSSKSFAKLQANGVRVAKPEHWVQMQVYMRGRRIDRALYLAVNKDDDALHAERVRLDRDAADFAISRGRRLALASRLPEPMPSAGPDYYLCKWCACWGMCFGTRCTKEVNCRTCAHSTACADSTFECARWDSAIPLDAQRAGCRSHVLHPDLVPWALRAGPHRWSATYATAPGQTVINGEDGQASATLLATVATQEARA